MDKVFLNKNIVRNLIEEIALISPSDEFIETQKSIDDVNGHYMLSSVGWEGNYREYSTFLHIDVKPNGMVWIQHDGTDLKVALLLSENGIPKSDIVLGFHIPFQRKLIPEFAIG
jgi:XisI protein